MINLFNRKSLEISEDNAFCFFELALKFRNYFSFLFLVQFSSLLSSRQRPCQFIRKQRVPNKNFLRFYRPMQVGTTQSRLSFPVSPALLCLCLKTGFAPAVSDRFLLKIDYPDIIGDNPHLNSRLQRLQEFQPPWLMKSIIS